MKDHETKKSLTLLTDLYQLTMAYGYWKTGRHEEEAAFYLSFRHTPFKGGYAVAAGLSPAMDFMEGFRFDGSDIDYLETLRGNDDKPLFDSGFFRFLKEAAFTCDVHAVPEGTVVFAQEPLLRIQGPLWQCQILESALLNTLNFQTLVATKAARVCEAARGEPVLEFGLRRAQGIDGSLAASRAAHIGGCHATSNVLAGKLFGIPVRGTHAHSWVMSFENERTAFDAYAAAMPNNCVFLVDTYDTLEGVKRAVAVGRRLREQGHKMVGIRLDSGDLAYLSVEARRILNEGGFPDAVIVASNDLDEYIIDSLKEQGAQIAVWGVGTRLVTAYDQPALGGVYKLGAIRRKGEDWRWALKLSEQAVKVSNPGRHQVRRYRDDRGCVGDVIYDVGTDLGETCTMVDPLDVTRQKILGPGMTHRDLLLPVFDTGRRVYNPPPLAETRRKTQEELRGFHSGIRRFVHPHQYPVGLEKSLFFRKQKLMAELRGVEVS